MDTHILVFGTSTTYGAWDEEGGWVNRLRKDIDKKIIYSDYQKFVLVYNLGVSGDKSTDILKRFKSETEARKDRHGEEVMFLLHVGINDCIYNEALGGLEVSKEEFKKIILNLLIRQSNILKRS